MLFTLLVMYSNYAHVPGTINHVNPLKNCVFATYVTI